MNAKQNNEEIIIWFKKSREKTKIKPNTEYKIKKYKIVFSLLKMDFFIN